MSEVKVNKLSPRSGTTVTIGDSGDTINIVGTLQNNGAPIPGDISSVVAGTGLSGGGTTGDVTLNIEAAQPTITSTGTLTSFTSTGIDDNATSTAITIDSSEHTHFGSTSSPSAGQGGVSILNYGTIQSSRTATGNLTHNEFYNPNGQVGNIKTSGSDLNINASSSLTFYTNNSEKMRVLSSGSVGIGTSNPAKKFHVYGSGSEIARFEATGGNSFIGLKDADDGTIAYIGADAGKLKFQTSGSGYSDKLLIDTAGNVGIGETAPLGLLHVKSADSGASANSGHNQVIAENSGNSGMSILSGTSSNGAICFGDSGNNCIGYLNYTHNGDHLDFGVNGSEKMRIDSSGNVGIGTTNPIADLSIVDSTTSSGIEIQPELTTDTNRITNYDRGDNSYKNFRLDALTQQFLISGSERMRIDSSGNLLINTTDTDPTGNNAKGFVFLKDNEAKFSEDGLVLDLNRIGSDGGIVHFRKDGTVVGNIGTEGGDLIIGTGDTGVQYCDSLDSIRPWNTSTNAARDGSVDLGTGNVRYNTIYAVGGSINTSDENEKQFIQSLTTAEMKVAKTLSSLVKTFKWNSAVEEKADNARTHTGLIAQQVKQAFDDEELDASKYALWCSDTWYEDANGKEVTEDTEGAISKTRFGLRYSELFAFIQAYNDQRFTELEARITTLENA